METLEQTDSNSIPSTDITIHGEIQELASLSNLRTLDRDMVEELIHTIRVYSGNRIEIQGYPDVLAVKDLCQTLRIGRVGAYKLLSAGTIQSFKIGNTYKIPKDSLIAYMNRMCGMERERGEQNDWKLTDQGRQILCCLEFP